MRLEWTIHWTYTIFDVHTGDTLTVVGSVVLPPWYIYCLVAVCSLYRLMETKEMGDRSHTLCIGRVA